MLRKLAFLVTLVLLFVGRAAFGAPCAGFTDVDSSSAFCVNVAWMKNRGITLGCAADLYCPNDPVSRLAMAAFISRLDRTLPPTIVDAQGVAMGPLVTFTGTLAQTHYRIGADAYSLLLLNAAPNSSPPTYNLSHTFAFYALANCAGAAYMDATLLVSIVGRFGAVVRGTGGSRLLFTVSSYPPAASTVPTQSYLQDGVCTNAPQSVSAYPVTLVEDLAAKFAEPFTVR